MIELNSMVSLQLKQPRFSLRDLFPYDEGIQQDAVNKVENAAPDGLNFFSQIKNLFFYLKLRNNLSALIAYDKKVLAGIDEIAEQEQMEIYADYNFNYTSKLENAKDEVKHFQSKSNSLILKVIGNKQMEFINEVFNTDALLHKKIYPDNPDHTTVGFKQALKEAYAGFQIED